MKKAILFDVDGTLLDSYEFVFGAVKFALNTQGYPYATKKNLQKAQGKPLVEFYKTLIPGADSAVLAEAHIQFQHKNFHLVKSFPKINKTLKILKRSGYSLAVISNRLRDSLLVSLKQAGILSYFDVIVAADDVVNTKPHKDHIMTALEKLEVKSENAFMVGDTEHDILAGKNAGVKTVGVSFGWMGKDINKYNPDFIIDDIEELLKILKIT